MDDYDPLVHTRRTIIIYALCTAVAVLAIYAFKYNASLQISSKEHTFQLASVTVLVLMVKNEEAIIERILHSAKGVLANHLVLCDTGSNDATVQLAQGIYAPEQMHVARFAFTNFEDARNECNSEAHQWLRISDAGKRIEWIAFADADFTVSARPMQKPLHDVNTIQIHAGQAGHPHNSLNMLISRRAFRNCRYRLWTHEFLDCDQPAGHYEGVYFVDRADGKSRPEKLERDIGLLKQWIAEKNETDLRPRALYYLARALEDSGSLDAAMDAYEQHNKEQPFTNYLFYAKYRQALVQIKLNKTFAQVEKALLLAHDEYDGYFRREPLYYLTRMARLNGKFNRCILYGTAGMNAPPIDHARMPLFLENAAYDWSILEELAYCYNAKGQKDRAKWFYQQILDIDSSSLDDAARTRIKTAVSLFYFALLAFALVGFHCALEPHLKRPNAVHWLFQKGDAHNHVRIDSGFRVAVPCKFACVSVWIIDQMRPKLVERHAKLFCRNVANKRRSMLAKCLARSSGLSGIRVRLSVFHCLVQHHASIVGKGLSKNCGFIHMPIFEQIRQEFCLELIVQGQNSEAQ